MRHRKKKSTEELFLHRPSFRKYMRRAKNGCLEYIRPVKITRPAYNPIVGLGGGKTTIPLRAWIWKQFRGNLPAGYYVHMRCHNDYCFSISHMYLSKSRPIYAPRRPHYVDRFSQDRLRSIFYFRGKAACSVVAQALDIPSWAIFTIWHRSSTDKEVGIPKGWLPGPRTIQKVENLSIPGMFIYLGPNNLRQALRDIAVSNLSLRNKELMRRIVEKGNTEGVANEFKLSNGGLQYVFRRSLADIYWKVGFRPWIYLSSKGRISQ